MTGQLADTFDGTAIDTNRWVTGNWNGGVYNPVVADGLLSVGHVDNAWVRSQSTFTRGVAEARLLSATPPGSTSASAARTSMAIATSSSAPSSVTATSTLASTTTSASSR
ncbi:MAG: hypothetical protein R2856_28735 [Caldilineaceae bacterium]